MGYLPEGNSWLFAVVHLGNGLHLASVPRANISLLLKVCLDPPASTHWTCSSLSSYDRTVWVCIQISLLHRRLCDQDFCSLVLSKDLLDNKIQANYRYHWSGHYRLVDSCHCCMHSFLRSNPRLLEQNDQIIVRRHRKIHHSCDSATCAHRCDSSSASCPHDMAASIRPQPKICFVVHLSAW